MRGFLGKLKKKQFGSEKKSFQIISFGFIQTIINEDKMAFQVGHYSESLLKKKKVF